MSVDILRLLIDCGTLVMIWLVQLVIYPGLCAYPGDTIQHWHKIYMKKVSLVIMPLMLGQVLFTDIQLYLAQTVYTIGSSLILVILWGITFYWFVPMHKKIESTENCSQLTSKMVRYNWPRTLLWTALFIWSFIKVGVSAQN